MREALDELELAPGYVGKTSLEEGRRGSTRPSPTCSRATTQSRGKKPSTRPVATTEAEGDQAVSRV